MAKAKGGSLLAAIFRSKQFALGYQRIVNAPSVASLDTPVTLARTRLIPDSEVGFDRRVRIYGRAWAKVTKMERKLVQGKTSGVDLTHEVTIRHDPSYTIDSRDMVFIESEIYVVGQVRDASREFPFVTLFTTHAGSMDEHDLTLVEPGEAGEEIVPTPEPEDDPNAGTDFPIWS